jgi:small-conductance mechanosensitive channel
MHRCFVVLCGLVLGCWALVAWAEGAALGDQAVQDLDARLSRLEQELSDKPLPEGALQSLQQRVPALRDKAQQCIAGNETRVDKTRQNLDTLGTATPDEAVGVQKQRRNLKRQLNAAREQLQLCRAQLLRGNQLRDRVAQLQQERLTERLSEQGTPAWRIIANNLRNPDALWSTARLFLLRESGFEALDWIELTGLLGLALLGVGGSLYARAPLKALAHRQQRGDKITAGFVRAVLACAADVLPALVTSVAVAIYLTIVGAGSEDWAFITLLSYGLAGYWVFMFAVHVFLAPPPPAYAYLPAPEPLLRSLARRLRTLALLVLAASLFSATLVVEGFPEPVRHLLRLLMATVLIVNLTRIIWLAGGLVSWHGSRLPRLLPAAAMLIALVAEWLGYQELAEYIVAGVAGTLLAFAGAWFVWRLVDELLDGLDEGRWRWQQAVRETLGVAPDEYVPGLGWLRALILLLLVAGFAVVALLIWGLSEPGFTWLGRLLNQGVSVGRLELVPIRLVWGMVVLIVLIALAGWFKQRLAQRWLARTRMERGAREAAVTVFGYVGIGVAVLVGLVVAGVNFENIALIAGALSVGIGFGLQNIFNNLVSGLILLFERPIKTDDWITVGTTEGYVKRISIRSTHIQTFDRADVIVPNSELIQGRVTNWMLRDPFGRIIVPVRVAYGSDPEQVRQLLVRVAHEHPQVIDDALLAPVPEALFRRFGDFALEFELRAFVRNIESFLNVVTDLNTVIEREFHAHGIEIPYPHQDIRLQRLPEGSTPRAQTRREHGDSGVSSGGGTGDMGAGGDGA